MATIQIKPMDQRFISGIWKLPEYQTKESVGMDLIAALNEPMTIAPGETKLIPTGFAMDLNDPLLMAVLAPRSGLGHKKGLVLGNLVGIIDSDYQGQVGISAWNRQQKNVVEGIIGGGLFQEPIVVSPGDRIAQMIFVPVVRAEWQVVAEFSRETERGEGGFGHTGGSDEHAA